MRMFLLACIAVVLLALGANLLTESLFAAQSGTTFAIERSTRLSPQYLGDERGYLAPGVHEEE